MGAHKRPPTATKEEIAAIAMSGAGSDKIQAATGISHRRAEDLRVLTGMTEAEFREKHEAQLRSVLDELLGKIRNEMDLLSPSQKAITFGILSDKLNLSPKSVTNALHLHFKGGDRANVLSSLLGSEGKRLVSRGKTAQPTRAAARPSAADSPPIDL